jgi:hypothetical protein
MLHYVLLLRALQSFIEPSGVCITSSISIVENVERLAFNGRTVLNWV